MLKLPKRYERRLRLALLQLTLLRSTEGHSEQIVAQALSDVDEVVYATKVFANHLHDQVIEACDRSLKT